MAKKNITLQQRQEIKKNVMYRYLILLLVASGIGLQGWRTVFNNFAVDVVGINGFQVGAIQSVREIPGFLSFLVVFVLIIIKEHRLSAYSVLLVGVGIICTAFFPSFWGLVVTTFIFSLGFHYFEATNKSLTLQYFSKEESPYVLGQQQSIKALTNVTIGLVILLATKIFSSMTPESLSSVKANALSLKLNFIMLGTIVIGLAVWALFWKPTEGLTAQPQKHGIVVKKKYWLFYALNFLSGARRQIFVVFAVFMLVERYHLSVLFVTVLFIFNNIVSYFVAPLVAKGVNKYGERTMLSLEYGSMIVVFSGYAFLDHAWIVAGLYIVDNIFFNFSFGINTFFHKIADPEDIAPSTSMGFAINHIAAVVLPVVGGFLWMIDYKWPFIIGVLLSCCSLILARKIRTGVNTD